LLRKKIYFAVGPVLKAISIFAWFFYSRFAKDIKIVIGSGDTFYKGWFPTDIQTLDITNESDFRLYFSKRKIDFILAEHLLEHLDKVSIEALAMNIKKFCNSLINVRIAVPDGFHTDKAYIDHVRPGGSGPAADDHKHLFNYISLTEIFVRHGYKFDLIEFWDENGIFRTNYFNGDSKGHIKRCLINHKNNIDGKPNYTSLIIDFTL
jgi:predicted SAM-dependent methyltransferase